MEIKKPSTSPDSGAALHAAAAEPSFRILYYGATGAAVPFKWESQPGTPKHPLSDGASLPPLTPPPSYYAASAGASPSRHKKKKRTSLRRLVSRNSSHVSSSPGGRSYSSSSTTSSSSNGEYYSPSPSVTESRKPRSVLTCLGLTAPLVNGGCGYAVSNVKNAVFSVVVCRRSSRAVDYVV